MEDDIEKALDGAAAFIINDEQPCSEMPQARSLDSQLIEPDFTLTGAKAVATLTEWRNEVGIRRSRDFQLTAV